LPDSIRCCPSIFQKGRDGYEAWCCSFTQGLAIGPDRTPEDPVIGSLPSVAWRVADDPADLGVSGVSEHKPLEV
jgi:hypothetical protein